MSASPSSPTGPPEKRFRSLKHSKTFTSLSDSIRSLRDPDASDVPSTPRARDTFKTSIFPFGQSASPDVGSSYGTSSPSESPQSSYDPPRPSLSLATRTEDITRSPKERYQQSPTSTGSPRSPNHSFTPRSDAIQGIQQSPQFLQKRTLSSPIPQTTSKFLPAPLAASPNPAATKLSTVAPSDTAFQAPPVPNLPPAGPLRSSTPASDHSTVDPDPTTIVAAAGSTHAAIIQLVKDKQAALTRSEQLWRLVEKQRAMILGLNRDLELALQEKERYRKKLQEQTTTSGKDSEETVDAAEATSRIVPEDPMDTSRELNNLARPPKPSLAVRQPTEMPITPVSPVTPPRTLTIRAPYTESIATAIRNPPSSPSPVSSRPSLAIDSRPANDLDHGRRQTKQIPSPVEKARKAPPKPLNLSQIRANNASNGAFQDSGSEYGDTDVTESPLVEERGRRKTRDDDEDTRDTNTMDEERLKRFERLNHSRSQMELSLSKPPLPLNVPLPLYRGIEIAGINGHGPGLPTSPRAPLDDPLHTPVPSSVGSMVAFLKPGLTSAAQLQQHTLHAPLMSPGLPLSPRPGDRPVNAPQPRQPNRAVSSLAAVGYQTQLGLPSSPRVLPASPFTVPTNSLPGISSIGNVMEGRYMPQARDQLSSPLAPPAESAPKPPATVPQVFRGFRSEHYPNLLLPPTALAVVDVRVDSCRLMPHRGQRIGGKDLEEDAPFTLAVCNKDSGLQLWRVEKTLQALNMVDESLRSSVNLSVRLPDKSLFSGQAPVKLDGRRAALDEYFQAFLTAPLSDERTALLICGFLSTDVIPPTETSSSDVDSGVAMGSTIDVKRRKEGYLSKKGKSFGGWKARYFVLENADLQYYEVMGGGDSGFINLRNAQIARQTASGTSEALEYRHAFMIMEPKRKDSSSVNRHILCAETDEERDAWIEALLPYTEISAEDDPLSSLSPAAAVVPTAKKTFTHKTLTDVKSGRHHPKLSEELKRLPLLHTISYDSTTAAESPLVGSAHGRASWSPVSGDNASETGSQVSSHASMGQQSIPVLPQTAQLLPKKSPTMAKKKRSMFGFRTKTNDDYVPPSPQLNGNMRGADPASKQCESSGRAVFGIPLAEAAEHFPPSKIDICLPAPVYRCIEFLEQKRAANEEGIFRLSGSNNSIKALKERFDSEGDVNLLDGTHHDVHAVASLLKMYLRELPESILTRKFHLDFLRIIDSDDDEKQKVIGINQLIHQLPEPNVELLATLSRFLIDIVNNSDVNKMSVRNVGIVFSPTLNIPAQLIFLFLTEYGQIFGAADGNIPS